MYTLYIPNMTELPLENISTIGQGARFSVIREQGRLKAYQYLWSDLTVLLTLMPPEELGDHLKGLFGFLTKISRNLDLPPPRDLMEQIKKTTLVLGCVAKPDVDAQGRAENIIGAICYNTDSVMFHGAAFYNRSSERVFPPPNSPPSR